MDSWLLILIVSLIYLVILCCLVGAVLIVASNRIIKARKERDNALKENKHYQELLNAYGIREINIGKDSDD